MNGHVYLLLDSGTNLYRRLSDGELIVVQQATDFTIHLCGAAYGPDAPDVLFKKI